MGWMEKFGWGGKKDGKSEFDENGNKPAPSEAGSGEINLLNDQLGAETAPQQPTEQNVMAENAAINAQGLADNGVLAAPTVTEVSAEQELGRMKDISEAVVGQAPEQLPTGIDTAIAANVGEVPHTPTADVLTTSAEPVLTGDIKTISESDEVDPSVEVGDMKAELENSGITVTSDVDPQVNGTASTSGLGTPEADKAA